MRKPISTTVRAGLTCPLFRVAILALAIALTLSCSDSGNNAPVPARKEKISGVSQKGPFDVAEVKIHKLNANMEQIGEPYRGTTDGSGNFEIEIEENMQYISLEVSGKYFNEVSGLQTNAPITLKAVADVSGKSVVNINVFTHLEYDKVLKLAKGNPVGFGAAKRAAQKEVLNALGMSEAGINSSEDISLFGGGKSDSLLLATSILLQGNRSAAEVSSLLGTIASEIKDNGTLSVSTKSNVASGLAGVNMGEVIKNILKLDSSAKVPSPADIDKIVAGMNGSSSSGGSGSSSGSSSSGGSSSSIVNPLCNGVSYASTQFCQSGTNVVIELCGTETYTSAQFCYNSKVGDFCGTRTETFDPGLYECKPSINPNGIYLKTPVSYGGKNYNAVLIGTQTWMAENLNYDASGSKCYDNNSANCNTYGRLYNWETAMLACPPGWHIPSSAEWNTLMKFINPKCTDDSECAIAGTKLKATSGWNFEEVSGNGTDDFGFSALPGGGGFSAGSFTNVGGYGTWWSSSNDGYVPSRYMDYSNENVYYDDYDKSSFFSVRCLKD